MANSAFTQTLTVPAASITQAQIEAGGTLALAAEQASTSGTAITFSGIPSGTKMIVVTLEGVSMNGTSAFHVQLGDSGGPENSGYVGVVGLTFDGGAGDVATGLTTGAGLSTATVAAGVYSGQYVFTLKDAANNTWAWSGTLARTDTAALYHGTGVKSTSAVLDRVVVTSGSADTFDAGAISIAYK